VTISSKQRTGSRNKKAGEEEVQYDAMGDEFENQNSKKMNSVDARKTKKDLWPAVNVVKTF